MANQLENSYQDNPAVRKDVERILTSSASFQYLDPQTQQAMTESLTKITSYLAKPGGPGAAIALAGPGDLRSQLARRSDDGNQPAEGNKSVSAPSQQEPQSSGTQPGGGQTATGRVGEVARATLSAIDFPSFVASLIQGTFQSIVDASIRQMEAYAELVKNVAMTVDQFMVDNVSEGTARDYLADRYEGLLYTDAASNQPQLRVNQDSAPEGELPSFFKELGFSSGQDIDDEALNTRVVPAARRMLAEQRQQTLATMVLMGINRILVDTGEITAKLVFHIDASESTKLRFDQQKTTGGNMSGRAGRSPFTANAIMVNTTNLNAQSDINVRADLTGQVSVKFRSEAFPLERFADSYAIQLINSRARVPAPQPAPATAPTSPAAPASPAPAAAGAPAVAPSPAVGTAPAAQSRNNEDPWMPKRG